MTDIAFDHHSAFSPKGPRPLIARLSCLGLLASLCLFLSEARVASVNAATDNWPQFRGPQASGQNGAQVLPKSWNVERGENIRWQTPVPGLAHASPIIWEGKIYLATVVKPGAK